MGGARQSKKVHVGLKALRLCNRRPLREKTQQLPRTSRPGRRRDSEANGGGAEFGSASEANGARGRLRHMEKHHKAALSDCGLSAPSRGSCGLGATQEKRARGGKAKRSIEPERSATSVVSLRGPASAPLRPPRKICRQRLSLSSPRRRRDGAPRGVGPTRCPPPQNWGAPEPTPERGGRAPPPLGASSPGRSAHVSPDVRESGRAARVTTSSMGARRPQQRRRPHNGVWQGRHQHCHRCKSHISCAWPLACARRRAQRLPQPCVPAQCTESPRVRATHDWRVRCHSLDRGLTRHHATAMRENTIVEAAEPDISTITPCALSADVVLHRPNPVYTCEDDVNCESWC